MVRMKSKTTAIVLLVLLVTLVMVVSPVSAATKNLSLVNAVVKDKRGGFTATFLVEGEFENFNGYVRHRGQTYKLNCNLKKTNSDVLVCHGANRGLDKLAYQTVQIVVAGRSFSTYVKFVPLCFGVYDWLGSDDPPNWWQVHEVCEEQMPAFGDFKPIETPVIGTWGYLFSQGAFCPPGEFNDFGMGWYYPVCLTQPF